MGHDVDVKVSGEGDDWETDPDFEVRIHFLCWRLRAHADVRRLLCPFQNDVSEQEQRWGAKTIEGSGRKEHIR